MQVSELERGLELLFDDLNEKIDRMKYYGEPASVPELQQFATCTEKLLKLAEHQRGDDDE